MLLLAAAGALIAVAGCETEDVDPAPLPPPQTATPADDVPVDEVPVEEADPATRPASFMDVVHEVEPQYVGLESARPRDVPEAASVVLDTPVLLCPRGDLWITRPDAPPLAETLADAAAQQTHVVPVDVAGVFWQPDDGGYRPTLFVPTDHPSTFEWRAANEVAEYAFGGVPVFADAVPMGGRLAVPNRAGGVDVIEPGPPIEAAQSVALDAGRDDLPPPTILRQGDGLMAWRRGGSEIGRWSPEAGWSVESGGPWAENLVQLVPMADGSVTQLHVDADGNAATQSAAATVPAEVDEAALEALVLQLAAPAAEDRNAAYDELAAFGPGAWPVLERMVETAPPEARVRLRALLRGRQAPLLGDMQILPGPVEVVSAMPHGGVVLRLPNGVMIPHLAGEFEEPYLIPAHVAVRPGLRVERLPPAMAAELAGGDADDTLVAWGPEWVLTVDSRGPMRWYGNHPREILPEGRRAFDEFVGIDSAGRWLFREPETRRTLVVDPRLPVLEPGMPVWDLPVEGGTVGWTMAGWPTMTSGGSWALKEHGWVPLDASAVEDRVLRVAPTVEPAAWVEGDALVTVAGESWPLPDAALGSAGRVFELPGEARRFALAEPGRVVRLEVEDGRLVEAGVFTAGVPNVREPDRLWLDPAGRLVWAYDGQRLAVAFPSGEVPASIASMMPNDAGRR